MRNRNLGVGKPFVFSPPSPWRGPGAEATASNSASQVEPRGPPDGQLTPEPLRPKRKRNSEQEGSWRSSPPSPRSCLPCTFSPRPRLGEVSRSAEDSLRAGHSLPAAASLPCPLSTLLCPAQWLPCSAPFPWASAGHSHCRQEELRRWRMNPSCPHHLSRLVALGQSR